MSDLTDLLNTSQVTGNPSNELMDAVYEELRSIARRQVIREKPGMTLQATAIVHEAYQKLFKPSARQFENRKHFFSVAAAAMRCILVDNARRRMATKRGGEMKQQDFEPFAFSAPGPAREVVALNEALDELKEVDERAAEIVELRYFVGLTIEEVAQTMGIGKRTANKLWKYARTWLRLKVAEELEIGADN